MPLFGRKQKDRSPAAAEAPQVEEEPRPAEEEPQTFREIASPYYASGDWEGLLKALDGMDPDRLEESEAIQWHTSRGFAAERLGRRDEASRVYSEGLLRHPDSSSLHTVMGRLLEEEARFDEALPHFRSVRLADGGAAGVITAGRYCYLWDAFDDAAALYSQIFDAYFELKIADDHLLYTRGLPFFTAAYGAQAAHLVLADRADEAARLLDECQARLSDLPGAEEERLTLDATTGQPARLIQELAGRKEKTVSEGFWGYHRMQLAAWLARESDPQQAEQHLASVTLGDDDFPWLEDVRLLAGIAAARRAGVLRTDDPRIAQFFERQPRLFEAEHAFHFGLLDEQQALKETYRASRRETGPATPATR